MGNEKTGGVILRMQSEISAKRSLTGERRGFLISLARQGRREMCD